MQDAHNVMCGLFGGYEFYDHLVNSRMLNLASVPVIYKALSRVRAL